MVLLAIYSFVLVQITCNACYTYAVPTESKLPVPVAKMFYTFAGFSIYRCSMMTVVQISLVSIFLDLIFDCSNVSYDARCMC